MPQAHRGGGRAALATSQPQRRLKFHDGSPVGAADAVASILRGKDRDVVGKAMFSAGIRLEVVDDLTFSLARPSPAMSQGFGLRFRNSSSSSS